MPSAVESWRKSIAVVLEESLPPLLVLLLALAMLPVGMIILVARRLLGVSAQALFAATYSALGLGALLAAVGALVTHSASTAVLVVTLFFAFYAVVLSSLVVSVVVLSALDPDAVQRLIARTQKRRSS